MDVAGERLPPPKFVSLTGYRPIVIPRRHEAATIGDLLAQAVKQIAEESALRRFGIT
jgi:hypothetical protein